MPKLAILSYFHNIGKMNVHTHTGAYGVIRNSDRVALVLKGQGAYVGQWDLPGGKIEVGEDPEATLLREIEEETGLHPDRYRLIGVYSNRIVHSFTPDKLEEEFFHVGILYNVHIPDSETLKSCYKRDTLGARWFTRDELLQLPLTPFAKRCVFRKD
ncbi:MAG: NUDIX domain-containing protein [Bacteroidota bacterium]